MGSKRGGLFGGIGIIIAVVALLLVGACSRVTVDAGQEAVLVSKPMFFGHGGVQDTPVTTGSTYVAFTTDPIMVDVRPQQFVFRSDDLMSSNGIPLHFDATIRLQVVDSVATIRGFGEQWYQSNVAAEFANRVRQAVRKHTMDDLAIKADGIEEVDAEVTRGMTDYIRATKLPLRLIKVTVGKATPPAEIKAQRVLTAAQTQRIQTEQQTKIAEDAREAAERSRAQADNAYRQTLNLNPAEFVDLQRIQMQKEVCGKEGKGGCTFIMGNGNPVIGNR